MSEPQGFANRRVIVNGVALPVDDGFTASRLLG